MTKEENIYEKDHSVDTLIKNITNKLNDYSEKWRTLGTELLLRRAEITDMAIRIIELEYKKYKEAEKLVQAAKYEELHCAHCDSQRCGDNPPYSCLYWDTKIKYINDTFTEKR